MSYKTQDQETALLRDELSKLLSTLKHNREKVPLDILKTKYKKGYDTLCERIRLSASDYAKHIVLYDIRIHKEYLDEAAAVINGAIERYGILKRLSKAAFSHQDIEEFDSLAGTMREKVLSNLEFFYRKHLGLYITPECLEDPEVGPLIYCAANDCVLQDGKWIPLELYESGSACLQKKCV